MVKPTNQDQGTINSVHHAIDVIEFLSEHGPATVTQIANKTGLPRPTLYRLLRTLGKRGVTRTDRKRHALSLRLHELGVRASAVDVLQIQVQPLLDRVGWREHDNTRRPHSLLGYESPAPQTITPSEEHSHSYHDWVHVETAIGDAL